MTVLGELMGISRAFAQVRKTAHLGQQLVTLEACAEKPNGEGRGRIRVSAGGEFRGVLISREISRCSLKWHKHVPSSTGSAAPFSTIFKMETETRCL